MAKPLAPKRPKTPKTPSMPAPPSKKQRTRKTFSVEPWTGSGQGEKIVEYGGSGVGKTTLAAMAPNPRFIGIDDGGRKIRDPRTNKPILHIAGVESFEDTRDALHQIDLFPKGSTCVVDTLTMLEVWAEAYMFEYIKHEKGQTVTSIEGYGYGKGYTHLFETMRLILQDCDNLVRRGVNVILICQRAAIKRANPGGVDFLQDGPKLSHPTSEKNSVRLHVCEWADHVVRIDYFNVAIRAAADAKVGKIVGSTERAIFTMPEPHYFAKTRTLTEPVIAFSDPTDDSLWRMLFPEQYANEQ